jgi:long-chain acyl-CoA synthetase
MEIDLELFRREVSLAVNPPLRLSAIDISPDRPLHTLVFLHGFGGKALQWQYQLNRFARANRVIAVDLRGHGRSDRPGGSYAMPVIQADLLALLAALVPGGKIVLVGHSFGGAVAAEFAASHPERVERLALIATAGEYRLNPFYRLLLRLPYPFLRLLSGPTRAWLGAPPDVLKSWYDDNLCCWKGWDIFRQLAMPTLVVRGHLDAVFERPAYEEVARRIPGAEEMDVGASGHLVMLERRDAVNRLIARFLESDQRSWSQARDTEEDPERPALLKERPWLAHYDPGVPYTLAIPPIPLHRLLDSAVRRFPRRAALVFEGYRLSYRRLGQEANRFANTLRWLGLQKGHRVILFLPNLPQMVIAFYGTLKAGGVAVFTLPTTEPEELIRQIRDAGAAILVTLTQNDELIARIKDRLEPGGDSPLRHIIFTHIGDYLPFYRRIGLVLNRRKFKKHLLDIPLDASMHVFGRILRQHNREAPEVEVSPGDLAVIQYTGGTTDLPKGVMLSHRNLVANALQTRNWMPSAVEGRERVLCVLPFSHSYGLTAALDMPIYLGATLVLKHRFEVGAVLRAIQDYRPTIFPGVPQMYVAIQDYPGVRRFGVSSIKACISGSAPLPVEVQESFEKLTQGRLVEGYGLTEASPVTHANPLEGRRKVGSIGVPLPSTEARVVDLVKGRRVAPAGQIGELAVRGPQVMLGYWGDSAATRRVLSEGGWLLTGDVAEQDAEGYFRIIARKADMWYPARPGKPAFPRDVEEVLFEVPQVKEAAVVAIAGQPIAFVIARGERPSVESLVAYSKRRLPPELVPRLVIFLDDFPRTFIGKVLRRELARRFSQSHPELAGPAGT